MSSLAFQIRDLEAQYADFDDFLSQEKWSDAQAIIDNLWDSNPQSAEFMRRKFLAAQHESLTHPEPKDPWDVERDAGERHDGDLISEGAHKDIW